VVIERLKISFTFSDDIELEVADSTNSQRGGLPLQVELHLEIPHVLLVAEAWAMKYR